MNAAVGAGLIALVVVVMAGVIALWLLKRSHRRLEAETPAEQYRREVANLRYQPQTWKIKRAAASRKQKHKLWAAGAAGTAGGYIVGTSGTGGDGSDGSAGACGGGGCGGGGGGCGGGGS